MTNEEIAAWAWAINDAYEEVGGGAITNEDKDFWMIWLGSLAVDANGGPMAFLDAILQRRS